MNEIEKQTDIATTRDNGLSKKRPITDVAAGPVRLPEQMAQAVQEFDSETDSASSEENRVFALLLKNAEILEDAGDYRLALNLLRNALMRRPDHPVALKIMGRCFREVGRYDEALKCFRALQRTDERLEGQIMMAEIYYLSERDEVALASYRDVLKNVISDQNQLFEIYKNIGNIHVRAGDFEAAEEFYNKAYTIDPSSDVLMVNYGTLEIQRGQFEEAVQRFRRAVELNPDSDRGWVGLSLVHRQMGDLELAWANVLRALDINIKNRTALRLVVDWSISDHNTSAAISKLQEYLISDGEDAEMSLALARLLTHSGRIAEARLEVERVLALDPGIQGGEGLRVALDKELRKRFREAGTEKRII